MTIDIREKQLLEKAIDGDKKAFCELVRMHQTKLRSFAVNIAGGNSSLADDILQEALVKAYLSITKYQINGKFTTWLWRIIKNELINHLRSPATKVEMRSDTETEEKQVFIAENNTESALIEKDVRSEVHFLISTLPEKLKIAIVLVDIDEVNYEDAAEILEISLSALKSRIFKGRRKLAELIQKSDYKKQLSQFRERSRAVEGGNDGL
jgi:RNA polymerase sigma-70 factor (ECF subfamily)